MDRSNFLLLIDKHLEGRTSPDEEEMLLNYIGSFQETEVWNEAVLGDKAELESRVLLQLKSRIKAKELAVTVEAVRIISPMGNFPLRAWRWAAAAVVIMAVATGAYFLFGNWGGAVITEVQQVVADIDPATSGAVLTLADGRQLVLDSLGNGTVARQNGTEIEMKDGKLTYEHLHGGAAGTEYNTLTTPRGKQIHVALSDGTIVWLNASSSLKYPALFTGNSRLVEVTGEAYFEVAENKKKPFTVKINDRTEVTVLGTHFNINAYPDEASINTTLLSGAVKIVAGSSSLRHAKLADTESVVLKPGQQAQIASPAAGIKRDARTEGASAPDIRVREQVDMDKVMAWKNGLFDFDDASLEEVMRQVSRWYDLEVVYLGGVPEIYFEGKMSRDIKLSGLLKALKASNVHFRIEGGRRIIVSPK